MLTSMSGSESCDDKDECFVVKGTITVEGDNDAKTRNKKPTFKKKTLNSSIIKLHNQDYAYQKSIPHLYTIQKILILLCH